MVLSKLYVNFLFILFIILMTSQFVYGDNEEIIHKAEMAKKST